MASAPQPLFTTLQHQACDVLVNNSGAAFMLPALDTSIEEAKKLFDLNFCAPFAVL